MARPAASPISLLLVAVAGAAAVLVALLSTSGHSAHAQDSGCEDETYDDAVICDEGDSGSHSGDDPVEFTVTRGERGDRRGADGNDAEGGATEADGADGNDADGDDVTEAEGEEPLGEDSAGEDPANAQDDTTGESEAITDDPEPRSEDDKTRDGEGTGDGEDSAAGRGGFETTTPRNYWSLAVGVAALFLFGIVFFIASRRTNNAELTDGLPTADRGHSDEGLSTSDDGQRTQE